MPPRYEFDEEETIWQLKLHHKDLQSEILFQDWMGEPLVVFQGLQSAQEDALKLLSYLCSVDFTHRFGAQGGFNSADKNF